jgi:MoaA/NifB/PqqE/SkfB family radical SAM enzyme
MYDSDFFEEERKNTLALDDMFQILDSINQFENKWGAHVSHFYITGGDPLLREDWKEFLGELKRQGKNISMMGNPETLNEANADFLAKMGLRRFQMSLDGLQPVHDFFRSAGSFDRTVEKISLLEKYNISSGIMFTLFPNNADQLIPLIRF